jgi:mgtE-like transporter
MLIGQSVSMVGSVIAGLLLDFQKEQFLLLAGALVILPAVFELGGSVAGAMGARIAHRLHEGVRPWLILRDGVTHAFLLTISSSLLLGLISSLVTFVVFGADILKIFIAVVSVCLSVAVVGLPIVALVTYLSYKSGADPDNIVGPVETTLFDLLSVIALAVVVGVLA